ncbi:MAG: C2H2-type zinc finger protein [Haloarculaceae archaeon]
MRLREDGTPDPDTAYDVPPELPVYECRACGVPFATPHDRTLHEWDVHDGPPDGVDRDHDALEAAREREETALRRFRLKALGAVVVLYFILLMIYALV